MRVNEEKVGLASLCCPTCFRTANESQHIKVHAVTHSFPSPIISFVESVPKDYHISHIEIANPKDRNSNSSKVASPSKILRDVHIVRTLSFYITLLLVAVLQYCSYRKNSVHFFFSSCVLLPILFHYNRAINVGL